jgi:hypothetical protein
MNHFCESGLCLPCKSRRKLIVLKVSYFTHEMYCETNQDSFVSARPHFKRLYFLSRAFSMFEHSDDVSLHAG